MRLPRDLALPDDLIDRLLTSPGDIVEAQFTISQHYDDSRMTP